MFRLALALGCAALTTADVLEQSFQFQPAVCSLLPTPSPRGCRLPECRMQLQRSKLKQGSETGHSQHRVFQADSGGKAFCAKIARQVLAQALGFSRAEVRGCELLRVETGKRNGVRVRESPCPLHYTSLGPLQFYMDMAAPSRFSWIVNLLPMASPKHLRCAAGTPVVNPAPDRRPERGKNQDMHCFTSPSGRC